MSFWKKILPAAAAAAVFSAAWAAEAPKDPQLMAYGHAYLVDQNAPLDGMLVEVLRDGKLIASGSTNKEGLFMIQMGNRADFLNLCVRPTAVSRVSKGGFCETVSAFQKASRTVGGVEFRELEHDFFLDASGANLNEAYEKEITHAPQEEAFSEMQKTVQANKEASEAAAALEAAKKASDAMRAQYRMPPNTAMPGPLRSIQVIGSVRRAEATGAVLDLQSVRVTAYSQEGENLGTVQPEPFGDFSMVLTPPGEEPFLSPGAIRVSSSQSSRTADGRVVPVWRDEWFQAASEKVIVNARLEPYREGPLDVPEKVRAGFPFLGLALGAAFAASLTASIIAFRLRVRRHDV